MKTRPIILLLVALPVAFLQAQIPSHFGGQELAAPPAQDSLSMHSGLPACTSFCNGNLGENIFPDGDFGSGLANILPFNPNLAPGYIYTLNPPPDDGYYCITNNTTSWGIFANTFWINIEDNGPEPNGYMMVVNATYQPGLFYEKTVDVCDNTRYEFSMDVISLIQASIQDFIKPNISFLIDGNVVCETGDIQQDETWHTERFSFTTALGQNNVTLALRNNAPGGHGNDLAIDNISFRACGPNITVPPTIRFCKDSPVTISAVIENAQNNSAVYQWQTFVNGQWQDIPDETNTDLLLLQPSDSSLYRLVLASQLSNLLSANCRVSSNVIRLEYMPDLQIQAIAQPLSCAGSNDGIIVLDSISGVPPFVYSWSGGQNVAMLQNLAVGTYMVTITDSLGCTGNTVAAIDAPQPLVLSGSTTDPNCFGINNASAVVFASGGVPPFNFLWSNGGNTDSISGLTPGIYSVTLTDQNSCTATISLSSNTPPALELVPNVVDVSCAGGNNASAGITAFGGVPPYNFSWNNGANSADIIALAAGDYVVTVTDANACTGISTVSIVEPTPLALSAVSTAVSCFGGANAMVEVDVQGGVSPYSYSWDNGGITAGINNLSAGNYSLTVTDGNMCTALLPVSIAQPTPLVSEIFTINATCFGTENGSATVTAEGGIGPYNIIWNTGSTSANMSDLAAGDYALTVTDGNNCTLVAAVVISEPAALLGVINNTDLACFGDANASAQVAVEGGVVPYIFNWSNGQTTDLAENLGVGNYSVTVTDEHACETILDFSLTEPDPLLLSTSNTEIKCFGDKNATAIVIAAGGIAPYSYHWNTGTILNNVSNLGAGNYAVTVSDANACTAISTVSLGEPTALLASASNTNVTCFGLTDASANVQAMGGTAPYQYLWNNGSTSANNLNLGAGNYQVTVFDQNGCSHVLASIVQQPQLLSGIITGTDINCHGASTGTMHANITGGTLPYSFQWSNGSNSPLVQNVSAGIYQLNLQDSNGCIFTDAIQITEPPAMFLETIATNIPCQETPSGKLSTAVSGGTAPYTYHWNTGQNSQEISGLSTGLYTVSVVDAAGCLQSSSEYLEDNSLHHVNLGPDLELDLGEYVELEAVLDISRQAVQYYSWSGSQDPVQCADCFTLQFQPVASGCERVLVRSKKGCIAMDTVCYKIKRQRNIYAPNVFTPNGDGENDFFTIYSDKSVDKILNLSIYNRWGGHVFLTQNISTNDDYAGWDGAFKGQDLNPDVYVWMAQILFIDGEKILLSGDVTLLR